MSLSPLSPEPPPFEKYSPFVGNLDLSSQVTPDSRLPLPAFFSFPLVSYK